MTSNLEIFMAAVFDEMSKTAAKGREKDRRNPVRSALTGIGAITGGALGQLSHRRRLGNHTQAVANMSADNPKWLSKSYDKMMRPRGVGIRRTAGGAFLGALAGNLASRVTGN